MQLTQFTDYSLRVLIYLGLKQEKCTVREIAGAFNVSQNHLVKVVHNLSKMGVVKSSKGKRGGLELAQETSKIRIGDIVEKTEPNLTLVECFEAETNKCPIIGACDLEDLLRVSLKRFIADLNQVTLEDLMRSKKYASLKRKLLGLS